MTRGKDIIGIFWQNKFFCHSLVVLGGHSLSVDSLGDYFKNGW
jgi:hypothetical protein